MKGGWISSPHLLSTAGSLVSALASINEVNLRRAWLVLRSATVSRFNSQYWTFISVCNQPAIPRPTQPSISLGIWVPALAGKAKAGMVHSVSGWTRGVQVKLWDPLRTHAISERLKGVFTTRRYINPSLPLPLPSQCSMFYGSQDLRQVQMVQKRQHQSGSG